MMNWLQTILFPRYLVGVVGIIENDRGELLLFRHTYRHQYPWGLPSGYLEHGEQPGDALRREIQEETGFSVTLSGVRDVTTEPDRPLLNVIFKGSFVGGTFVASAEISEAGFFPPSRLPPLLPSQRRLIESLSMEVFDQASS
jgi:8-oxo-dGTP diphosphatase